MDRHFLELWGNLLIQAAKGQQQMEDLSRLVNEGIKGAKEHNPLFQKFYEMNQREDGDSKDAGGNFEKAAEDFQSTLKTYLNLMGVVPKSEHISRVEKYENLKKKSQDQEETIQHLRMLLEQKGMAQEDTTKGFEDLVRNQSDQFQDLLKGLGKFLQGGS